MRAAFLVPPHQRTSPSRMRDYALCLGAVNRHLLNGKSYACDALQGSPRIRGSWRKADGGIRGEGVME